MARGSHSSSPTPYTWTPRHTGSEGGRRDIAPPDPRPAGGAPAEVPSTADLAKHRPSLSDLRREQLRRRLPHEPFQRLPRLPLAPHLRAGQPHVVERLPVVGRDLHRPPPRLQRGPRPRSEEHTSEL